MTGALGKGVVKWGREQGFFVNYPDKGPMVIETPGALIYFEYCYLMSERMWFFEAKYQVANGNWVSMNEQLAECHADIALRPALNFIMSAIAKCRRAYGWKPAGEPELPKAGKARRMVVVI